MARSGWKMGRMAPLSAWVALVACSSPPAAQAPAQAADKPSDAQIAHIAYTAGQLDIEAGKQALDKSKNKDVRAFAQQMVADHSSVNAARAVSSTIMSAPITV